MAEEKPKNRRRLWLLGGVVFLCGICTVIGLSSSGGDDGTTGTQGQPTQAVAEQQATAVVPEEPTAEPSDTPVPAPTSTPAPTDTPLPTPTPTPVPDPLIFSGTGDSIIEVEKNWGPSLVHIVGNAADTNFAVWNYDANGERIELLVNTIDPYEGYKQIDVLEGEDTKRISVEAVGDWTIEIYPFVLDYLMEFVLEVPGVFLGEGDSLVILQSGVPDLAIIQGNEADTNFAVWAYGTSGRDLLVNVIDPYEGTSILPNGTNWLVIQAVGPWTIEVTAK